MKFRFFPNGKDKAEKISKADAEKMVGIELLKKWISEAKADDEGSSYFIGSGVLAITH